MLCWHDFVLFERVGGLTSIQLNVLTAFFSSPTSTITLCKSSFDLTFINLVCLFGYEQKPRPWIWRLEQDEWNGVNQVSLSLLEKSSIILSSLLQPIGQFAVRWVGLVHFVSVSTLVLLRTQWTRCHCLRPPALWTPLEEAEGWRLFGLEWTSTLLFLFDDTGFFRKSNRMLICVFM